MKVKVGTIYVNQTGLSFVMGNSLIVVYKIKCDLHSREQK